MGNFTEYQPGKDGVFGVKDNTSHFSVDVGEIVFVNESVYCMGELSSCLGMEWCSIFAILDICKQRRGRSNSFLEPMVIGNFYQVIYASYAVAYVCGLISKNAHSSFSVQL